MKKIFLALFSICFAILFSPLIGRAVELEAFWDYQETESLMGFRVYKSRISGKYIKALDKVCEVGKSARSCRFQLSGIGTFYFVATAFWSMEDGESAFSNEYKLVIRSAGIPLMLQNPANFQVR